MERYWVANGILASNECGGLVKYDDAQRALDAERELSAAWAEKARQYEIELDGDPQNFHGQGRTIGVREQLSQLQGLVRALPDQLATIEKDLAPMNLGTMTSGDMKVFDKTKALVMQTVMARLKRTLDATTPATKGGDGE